MQFLVNECIVGSPNGNMIAIAWCKGNLYQMTFTKVCGANATNFVRSRVGGGLVELWHHRLGHLDVRSNFALQSIVRGVSKNPPHPWVHPSLGAESLFQKYQLTTYTCAFIPFSWEWSGARDTLLLRHTSIYKHLSHIQELLKLLAMLRKP